MLDKCSNIYYKRDMYPPLRLAQIKTLFLAQKLSLKIFMIKGEAKLSLYLIKYHAIKAYGGVEV
jgi:hypothetical protein